MEMLMQYVWQTGLWGRGVLEGCGGERVEVIDRGQLNTGSGPDFFNAKIRIGGQLWAGNIEMHVRASDWMRHGHDSDAAYDNVILHVVAVDDCDVRTPVSGRPIVQVVMKDAQRYHDFFERLTDRRMPAMGCADRLRRLTSIEVADWLGSLGYERIQRKAADIAALVESMHGDWAEASYVTLARGLGFGTNSDAMERTARATPLHILGKHADRPLLVEAMLMGQGGLLGPEAPGQYADEYHRRLCSEYEFMRVKFSLAPLANAGWRSGGFRPAASPWRRLGLLAACVCCGIASGSRLMDVSGIDDARALFGTLGSDSYWTTHSYPGIECSHTALLSGEALKLLLINVIIPLMYARAEATGRYDRTAVCPDLLQHLRSEDNRIIRLFRMAGITPRDAFESQALIELYNAYCLPRRCISCRFSHKLLAKTSIIS